MDPCCSDLHSVHKTLKTMCGGGWRGWVEIQSFAHARS